MDDYGDYEEICELCGEPESDCNCEYEVDDDADDEYLDDLDDEDDDL